MDIAAVFTGLANAADTISGLNAHAFTPESVVVPVFFPIDVEIGFDQTFGRGSDDAIVTGQLLVSRASDRSGQKELKDFLKGSGSKSIKAALEADQTLGGACDVAHLRRAYGYGPYEHAGIEYVGIRLEIGIMGGGS